MPTLEERVVEVREAVRSLEDRMDARFESVDRRFDTVDRRIDALEQKVSNHFVWLAGLQVTTLLAIIGALLART